MDFVLRYVLGLFRHYSNPNPTALLINTRLRLEETSSFLILGIGLLKKKCNLKFTLNYKRERKVKQEGQKGPISLS